MPRWFSAHWTSVCGTVLLGVMAALLRLLGVAWFSTAQARDASCMPQAKRSETPYEGLGRGERTSLRGGVSRDPPKDNTSGKGTPEPQATSGPSSAGKRSTATPPGQPVQQPSKSSGAQPKSAAAKAQSPNLERPDTPRTAARKLVGARMGTEQAAKAAEKIVTLRPYVSGEQVTSLNSIWKFFDMVVPDGSSFDANDPVMVTLKGKLNRQRLLLHPDKNGHPDAEKTFKFLEQCHQRLTGVFLRKDSRRNESVHQRTRREEDELREEQERRRREEEDRKAKEEQIQREEDEKEAKRQEEERKAELQRERLEAMLRDKEARGSLFEQRRKLASASPGTSPEKAFEKPQTVDETEAVLPNNTGVPAPSPGLPTQPVGSLSVQVLAAKDLPSQGFFTATNAYAKVWVGYQRCYSPALPGCSPAWGSCFTFDVHRVDTALKVEVYREGLGWGMLDDELLGSTEVPFLDLEEWSGCTIGRVLENEEGKSAQTGNCMVLELKASLHWF